MNNLFQTQPELRFGAPVCDQLLPGKNFTIGYSWYLRQVKWVLEIMTPFPIFEWEINGFDHARADLRIPRRYRAGVKAYEESGYYRAHLSSTADQVDGSANIRKENESHDTYLLSNMSPQNPDFNEGVWRDLEMAIRELNSKSHILETYVLTAPVFYYDRPIETIGDKNDENITKIPVPHAFIKSVLTEDKHGSLRLWTFEMENKNLSGKLENFLIPTYDAELKVGARFWDGIAAGELHNKKQNPEKIWSYTL